MSRSLTRPFATATGLACGALFLSVPATSIATAAPAPRQATAQQTSTQQAPLRQEKAVARASKPGQSGYFTMWQDDGFEGHQEARKGYDTNLHNDSCAGCDLGPGGDFGDDMSSFVNKTDYWWSIYINKNYEIDDGGTYDSRYCVRPNSNDADMGNNDTPWGIEDTISSVRKMSLERPVLCRDRQVIGHNN